MQTRSVGTIAASTACCLRTTAALCSTWHSVVPGTIQYCWCVLSFVIRTKSKLRKRGFALVSDLQRQAASSNIMMHPSGHPAARRQRCSHPPIPSRQPRSVFASTWCLSRACYVRACCVLSSLCGLKNYHHRHFTYGKSRFIRKLYGIDRTFFFEDDFLAERVSRRLLGPAEPEG